MGETGCFLCFRRIFLGKVKKYCISAFWYYNRANHFNSEAKKDEIH